VERLVLGLKGIMENLLWALLFIVALGIALVWWKVRP